MGFSEYHLNYLRDEDRIFIFVRDSDGVEHAFGLARRLFKRLWPALGKAVHEMSETAANAAPGAQKEVLQFEQEGAVSEARQDGTLSFSSLPKVEKRLSYLLKTIRIRKTEDGGSVLALSADERTMNIPINHDRLIVFCDALKALVAKSDWDLAVRYPWEGPAAAGPVPKAAGKRQRTRH
jgi:hypothetical protein